MVIVSMVLGITAKAQDSTGIDTGYCRCRDVTAWDSAHNIFLDIIHRKPFTGSCRTNVYYGGSFTGYYDRQYTGGKEVYVGIYDKMNRKTSEDWYKENGVIKSVFYDTLGRISGILAFKRHSRKSDLDYSQGKLIYREKGVERLLTTTPDKWFIRMHHTEWDSAGHKTYNSFYREHTIYFPHGRGHDERGWEFVLRENGKRCLHLRRNDDYEFKVCIIPLRKRSLKLH